VIPAEIITALEAELDGLNFGKVSLTIQVHDGNFRFVVGREQSIIPGKITSGATGRQRD
jgi:hypothetical protein